MMLLTLYPNFELRARIPPPPLSRKRQGGVRRWKAESLPLSIVENLRQQFGDEPFNPPKEKSDRPGYGGKPLDRTFSIRARRMIARCGGAFGGLGGREATVFLTGTIPGGTDAAFEAVSRWSSWIVHELLRVIPRSCRIKASECQYLWVWEWQKRGALHWHAVFEFETREVAQRCFDTFKGHWIRCLESVGRFAGIDIAQREQGGTHAGSYSSWRTRAEWARKNPARYLAKYMGKAKMPEDGGRTYHPPTRWYSISRSLLEQARRLTIDGWTPNHSARSQSGLDEEEVALIERLSSKASKVSHFPDKVREGYTFVFYFKEENHQEVLKIMQEFTPGNTESRVLKKEALRARSYALTAIGSYPHLLSRFLSSCGDRERNLYSDWVAGLEVPDDEVFFLNQLAHAIFLWEGWKYKGQVPERSAADLPGRKALTMEDSAPPHEQIDQGSLFP